MIDDFLEKYNLKYEDLNAEERETYNSWLTALQQGKLTIDGIGEYIASMRESVENDLTKTGHDSKQDYLLKARLRNYMLLEAFLATPEKARKQIERSLSGMASKVKT